MSHHLFRDAAIVGVYNTKQARRLEGQSTGSLIRDAILGALNDAGMSTSDLDGILVCPPYMDRTTDAESRRWGYELGLRDYWVGSSVTPFLGVIEAAAAIAMGQCTTVVVATGQAGLHSDHQSTAPWTQIGEWTLPWGLFSVAEFALVARRH